MVQLEDGYTRIANELLEAIIRFPFTKREMKIVMAILRKTYGFNKKADKISLSQLAEMTGLTKAHVSETVPELGTIGVITVNKDSFIQLIEFNKNYKKWVPKTGTVPKTGIKGSQNGKEGVPKTGTTKDNSTKDKQKKGGGVKKTPSRITDSWHPNETNLSWLKDSGMSDFEQQKIIREFRDFWKLNESKRSNWDMTFRQNPIVKQAVNRALSKPKNNNFQVGAI